MLFILLMQSGGLFLVYKVQQWNIQNKMSQVLKNDQTGFIRMTLTVSEYQKYKVKSNEICWKGKMYDVKSAVISGDNIDLLVINDIREENILRQIKLMTDNAAKQHRELPHQIIELLIAPYLCAAICDKMIFQNIQEIKYPSLTEVPDSITSDVPSPPPELV